MLIDYHLFRITTNKEGLRERLIKHTK